MNQAWSLISVRYARNLTIKRLAAGLVVLGISTGFTFASAATAIGVCAEGYAECLQIWKADRLTFLKSDGGYLNLAGLFWLQDGGHSFGGGQSVDLKFPGLSDGAVGYFALSDDGVRLTVNPDFDVRLNDQPISDVVLRDDTSNRPDVVTYKNFSWTIIRRVNQFAVRLRDSNHPALTDFAPIDYFPIEKGLRVPATLHRYAEPRVIRVNTVIPGLEYNPTSPGVVTFTLGDEQFELEAYTAGKELFLVFGDTTNRGQTYPAGRFLYTQAPESNEAFVLDFNTAHSPPCAYNDFATCPVASPRNQLPISIEAGERYDRSSH